MRDSVIRVDVREHIEAGRDPFSVIMGAVSRLNAGDQLLLIAPFEPTPLFGLMASRGFDYKGKELPDGSWEILFFPIGE